MAFAVARRLRRNSFAATLRPFTGCYNVTSSRSRPSTESTEDFRELLALLFFMPRLVVLWDPLAVDTAGASNKPSAETAAGRFIA